MLAALAPIVIKTIFDKLGGSAKDIAKKIGIDEDVVGKVLGATQQNFENDMTLRKQIDSQVENARQHDIALIQNNSRWVNDLRGTVRPLITLICVLWYVYSRVNGIALATEDYAVIGGVIAFWFGVRPFEKHTLKNLSANK